MSVEIKKGCYIRITRDKKTMKLSERPLTNFVIQPLESIRTEAETLLRAVVKPRGRLSGEEMIIPACTWESSQAFVRFFNRLGQTVCTLAGPDAQLIKQFVFSKNGIVKRRGTHVLGRHGNQFLLGRQVVGRGGVLERPPLVYVPRVASGGGLSDSLQDKLRFDDLPKAEYRAFLSKFYPALLGMNTPEVMCPRIGWFFATSFKPCFLTLPGVGHFPHLAETGETGAGKTSGLQPMCRMFGFNDEPYGANQTPFVLLRRISETNATPLWFDEFKPGKIPDTHLKALSEALRKSYTGECEDRGRQDQSTISYYLVAPVVISGEMAFTERALQQRIIPSAPRPSTLTGPESEPYKAAFHQVVTLPLSAFAIRYLAWTLWQDVGTRWQPALALTKETLGTETPDRIVDNLAVMVFGLRCFEDFGREWGIPEQVFNGIHENIPVVLRSCRDLLTGQGASVPALDQFLSSLATMAQVGRLRAGQHYYLSGDTLYVSFVACYGTWREYARQTEYDGDRYGDADYRRMFRENYERLDYVRSGSESPRWGRFGNVRSYAIDLVEAERHSVDVSGFRVGFQRFQEQEDWDAFAKNPEGK